MMGANAKTQGVKTEPLAFRKKHNHKDSKP